MRKLLIPVVMTAVVGFAMFEQAKTVVPVVCDPPAVSLTEMSGFVSETRPESEAELDMLPSDTQIEKRVYSDQTGNWFLVTLVIGGASKGSIHRSEGCLSAQGFQMTGVRTIVESGVEWRMATLDRQDVESQGFAYTFFNQDGFKTSSHFKRIFKDVWDRSVHGRIDRWVMITVHSATSDERQFRAFLTQLKGSVGL